MRIVFSVLVAVMLTSCSSSGGGTGSSQTDSTDGTDGTDSSDGSAVCANADYFAGATCDPTCEESGCSDGQICTVGNSGPVCAKPGTQVIGKGCNDSTPCAEGLCLQDGLGSTCFAACVNDIDCPAGFSCSIIVSDTSPEIRACAEKGAACDIFTQECPAADDGSAQGCYLAGVGPECAPAGTLGEGDDCDEANECKPGLLCISDRCHVACNPKTNGPDPKCTFSCSLGSVGIQGSNDVAVCDLVDDDPSCNLLQQNCDAGKACYVTGQGAKCKDAGTTPVGSDCTGPGDCVPNSVCQAGKCRQLCDPADALHEECESNLAQCSSVGQGAGYCDE